MMKNITSKFAAIAAIGLFTISAQAFTQPTWVGTNNPAEGGAVFGADSNLTLTLATDWATGANFNLNVNRGTIPTGGTYLVCNGDDLVGEYVTVSTPASAGDVTVITFQMSNDAAIAPLIREDQNLTFVDGKSYNPTLGSLWGADLDCSSSKTMTLLPDYVNPDSPDENLTQNCVTVFTDNGIARSNGILIPEMTSYVSDHVAKYREEVMISCTVPVCKIDTKRRDFIPGLYEEGVNLRINMKEENATTSAAFDGSCYAFDCEAPEEQAGTYHSCETNITVRNNTSDANITIADFELAYSNVLAGVVIDLNGSAATIGSTTSVDLTTIEAGKEGNVSVTFTSDGSADILPGELTARLVNINGLATIGGPGNHGSQAFETDRARVIAKIEDTTPTKFTVSYMNPTMKTFAMVTARSSAVRLNATITDENGKTAQVDLGMIAANSTKFIWADTGTHPGDPLEAAAIAAGLGNAWHVEFEASASVDAAAYMETANGERTLTINYPKYSHGLEAGVDNAFVSPTGFATTPLSN